MDNCDRSAGVIIWLLVAIIIAIILGLLGVRAACAYSGVLV